MALSEQAICIRTTDYSETSQVLRFLTRGAGIVSILAKGSKRPKSKSGGALDLLSEGQIVFTQPASGAMGTLFEFTETVSHLPLRTEARRLNTGLYMTEFIGLLLGEGDAHPDAFDLLHNALGRLADADAPVEAVLAYFQWRMLRHAGLLGQLSNCVECDVSINAEHGAGAVFFSSARGGLLCGSCGCTTDEKINISTDAITGLAGLQLARGRRGVSLSEAQTRGVNRLLSYHATYQLGKPLRMARYVIR
ncbi:MAG: DNA repair protein RecO [Phycisphaerales bacterium]|jgi:DNA repair protein RecO (recombination protein O)|nr:DNA repair protein RecO [Phycisphaerales bacterium]